MRVLVGMAAVLRDQELRPDDYRLHNHEFRKRDGQSYSELGYKKAGLCGKCVASQQVQKLREITGFNKTLRLGYQLIYRFILMIVVSVG